MKQALRAAIIRLVSALFGRAVASCEEAGRLTSEARDRRLKAGERVSANIHNLLCRECARYARQLEVLAETARTEKKTLPLSDEAKKRIADAIREADTK